MFVLLLLFLFYECVRELTSGPRTPDFHFIISHILIAKEIKPPQNERNTLGTLTFHINIYVSFLMI